MAGKAKLPSKHQASVIAHFAGRAFAEKVRSNELTYEKCRQNGWIKRTDEFPYHEATPDGIAALDAYEQANQATGRNTYLMDLVRAYGESCYLHTPNSPQAHRLLTQIEQAITGKEA